MSSFPPSHRTTLGSSSFLKRPNTRRSRCRSAAIFQTLTSNSKSRACAKHIWSKSFDQPKLVITRVMEMRGGIRKCGQWLLEFIGRYNTVFESLCLILQYKVSVRSLPLAHRQIHMTWTGEHNTSMATENHTEISNTKSCYGASMHCVYVHAVTKQLLCIYVYTLFSKPLRLL